jgi:hypothetical protein
VKGERIYDRGYAQACKDAADEIKLALVRSGSEAGKAAEAGRELTRAMVQLQLALEEWAALMIEKQS